MAILSIKRDTNNNVSLVRIITNDTIATFTAANYIKNQKSNIDDLNDGEWQWFTSDMILAHNTDGNALFTFTDDTFSTVVEYGQAGGFINPGLANEVAYYAANGSVISGLPTIANATLTSNASGQLIWSTTEAALPFKVTLVTTSPYAVTLEDLATVLNVESSSGNITISLPVQGSIALPKGFYFYVSNTGVNGATLSVSGVDTLLGGDIIPSGSIGLVLLADIELGNNTFVVSYEAFGYKSFNFSGDATLSYPLATWNDISTSATDVKVALPDVRFGVMPLGKTYYFKNTGSNAFEIANVINLSVIPVLNPGEVAAITNNVDNVNSGGFNYFIVNASTLLYDSFKSANYQVLNTDLNKTIPTIAPNTGLTVFPPLSSTVPIGFNFKVSNTSTTGYVTITAAGGETAPLVGSLSVPPNSEIKVQLLPLNPSLGSISWLCTLSGTNQTVNAQSSGTTTYQLSAVDFDNNIVTMSAVTAMTLTIPQASTTTIPAGSSVTIVNLGSANITIAKQGTDVLNGNTVIAPNGSATIVNVASGAPNTFEVIGGTSTLTYSFTIPVIATVANQTYYFNCAAPFAGTLTSISGITRSGTCTVNAAIGGVNVTGTALSATNTVSTQSITAANTFVAGNSIQAVVISNSTALDLSLELTYTVTL